MLAENLERINISDKDCRYPLKQFEIKLIAWVLTFN